MDSWETIVKQDATDRVITELELFLRRNCPPGVLRTLALSHLETVRAHALASIEGEHCRDVIARLNTNHETSTNEGCNAGVGRAQG